MPNTLQAEISTKVGQTFGVMDQLQSKVTQLKSGVADHTRETNKFQAAHSAAHRTAHKEATELAQQYRNVGHAFAFAGGELGHLGHSVSMLSRLGGHGGAGLLAVAAAASAAAVGMRILSSIEEDRIEHVRKAAEAEYSYADALIKSREAAEKKAHGAAGRDAGVRDLVGAGGSVAEANELGVNHGVDFDSAVKGLTAIRSSRRLKTDDQQYHAHEAALRAFKAGVPFDEAAEMIAKHGNLASMAQDAGKTDEIAARVVQQHRTGQQSGWNILSLESAQRSIGRDPYLQANERTREIDAQTGVNQRRDVAAGAGEADARRELALSQGPDVAVAAETAAAEKKREQDVVILQKQLDAMNGWFRLADRVEAVLHIDRSVERQIITKQNEPVSLGKHD